MLRAQQSKHLYIYSTYTDVYRAQQSKHLYKYIYRCLELSKVLKDWKYFEHANACHVESC